jgi:hypothetical protein
MSGSVPRWLQDHSDDVSLEAYGPAYARQELSLAGYLADGASDESAVAMLRIHRMRHRAAERGELADLLAAARAHEQGEGEVSGESVIGLLEASNAEAAVIEQARELIRSKPANLVRELERIVEARRVAANPVQ